MVVQLLGLKKSVVYILVHTVTLPSKVVADVQTIWKDLTRKDGVTFVHTDAPTPRPLKF